MRKLFTTILVLAIVTSSLCFTVFAANSDVYFTEATIDGETATTYLKIPAMPTGLLGINFSYTVTGGTAVVTDTGALASYDSTMTLDEGTTINFTTGGDGIASTDVALDIVKFVITKDSAATETTITISLDEIYDMNGESPAWTVEGTSISWVSDPDPVVKDATVAEITEEGWVWTDAKAYKVSTIVEGDVSEVSCVLKVSYTRNSDSAVITDKVLDSINLAGVYVTEGSTISFKPIFKGTDAITGLSVKGTFTLK